MANFGHNGGGGFAGIPPGAAGHPMHVHPGNNGMNGGGSSSGMMPPPPPPPPQAALLPSSYVHGGVMTAPPGAGGGFGPAVPVGSPAPAGGASVADAQAMLEASSPQVRK